jgi:hypothetical protein
MGNHDSYSDKKRECHADEPGKTYPITPFLLVRRPTARKTGRSPTASRVRPVVRAGRARYSRHLFSAFAPCGFPYR